MNAWLDDGIVGLLLLASALYAAYSLGPKPWRARMMLKLGNLLERSPRALGLKSLAGKLKAAAARRQAGCGGCDNCESTPATDAKGEFKIPVSKIGRRI
jgi:hypothetical protein